MARFLMEGFLDAEYTGKMNAFLVEQILRKLEAEYKAQRAAGLSNHVDPTPLQNLAHSYLQAITGKDPSWLND